MRIILNGKPHRLDAPSTVAALLESLALAPGQAAVEKNRAIVPRSAWAREALNEGDEIEIVHFIGGG